jgi:Flp pilus assembly pilin Flp
MRIVEMIWMLLAHARASVDSSPGVERFRWMAQSTVEYALVGALVVIAAAGAMSLLGTEITTVFTKITTALSGH